MSRVREDRCKLAVSLALAYKDFEVYQDARVGDERIDIKAEKLQADGKYDSFYVLVIIFEGTPEARPELRAETRRLTKKLKRPVYLALLKDDASEMMLDDKLKARMMLPDNTRVIDMPSRDSDFTPY
jgi:hypothetical protein